MSNKTIKQQIIERVLASLSAIRDQTNLVYTVRESNDYTAQGTYRTELIVVVGTEAEQSRDDTGQTYLFDIHVKIFVPHPPPPQPRDDYRYESISARVIQALESPTILTGLGAVVIGAEEQTYLRSGLSKIAGPWVRIAVQYSRKRANPFETYDPTQAKKVPTLAQSSQPDIMQIY